MNLMFGRIRWLPLVLALSAALLLGGCSGADATSTPKAMTIAATDLAFQPKEFRLKRDQPQTVRLDNRGKLLHDWTIEKIAVTGVKEQDSAGHAMDRHGGGTSGAMPGSAMPGGAMPGGMMGGASANGDFALHVAAEAGHQASVQFTPTEAGIYTFYCTVPGHREAGMEGRLIIE